MKHKFLKYSLSFLITINFPNAYATKGFTAVCSASHIIDSNTFERLPVDADEAYSLFNALPKNFKFIVDDERKEATVITQMPSTNENITFYADCISQSGFLICRATGLHPNSKFEFVRTVKNEMHLLFQMSIVPEMGIIYECEEIPVNIHKF